MDSLLAITPIDGRYKYTCNDLKNYVSEYALFRYRIIVEINYFIFLCKQPIPLLKNISNEQMNNIQNIITNFSPNECLKVKKIEAKTKHDVKAIEYYIQEQFIKYNLEMYIPYIHFGLTSQDVNSTANILAIYNGIKEQLIPSIKKIMDILNILYNFWKHLPMLSRTQGQAASPTTSGKELYVFYYRLENQLKILNNIEYRTKFGGAVGNFNAHKVAFPHINWEEFGDNFINSFNLIRNKFTTQISNYDEISNIFDNIKRINTILIDLNIDIWYYISMGYLNQKINTQEVGSSTMPHKINPINFENSEGNLIMSISLLECISRKLPISRLQRDLTDSTILRNIGSVFGYSLIGYKSLITGLNKISLNNEKIKSDLNDNSIVICEGMQTILRREGIPNAYELFKDFIYKNETISEEKFNKFINQLDISDTIKEELHQISAFNYIGYADK